MGMFSILAGGDLLVIVTLGAIRWVAVWIFWAGMFTSLVTSFEWSVLELIVFKVGAVELIEGLLKYKKIYYITYKIYCKNAIKYLLKTTAHLIGVLCSLRWHVHLLTFAFGSVLKSSSYSNLIKQVIC